ncbi:MAG: hypothetical protein U0Q22_03045 [Acidimicrobiales bacterium]
MTPSRTPRPNRVVRTCGVVGVALVAVTLTVGCSDDSADRADATTTVAPTTAVPRTTTTTTVPGATTAPVVTTTTAPPATTEAPAASKSTTSLLPARSGLPSVAPKNSKGQPILLDETALLACAQDQIASVSLKQGASNSAATALTLAAQRAEASAVAEVKASAASLRAAAASGSPQAEVDRFLALCVDRGFEY